jgi:hypothetical protein
MGPEASNSPEKPSTTERMCSAREVSIVRCLARRCVHCQVDRKCNLFSSLQHCPYFKIVEVRSNVLSGQLRK